MCACHDVDAVLLAEIVEVKRLAVTGRKGNNKARAGTRYGLSGGGMRQNPLGSKQLTNYIAAVRSQRVADPGGVLMSQDH